MTASAPRFILLDRDGTLIRHIPYLSDPFKVEILPTVREGLRRLIESGCKLFLHTNQSGIGRGYFSFEAAVACNEEMIKQLNVGHALFDDICICPEAPDQPVNYRKPSPRYGLELIARHGVTAGALCYVGDNLSDLLAARNVGCRAVGVSTGEHDLRELLRENGEQDLAPVFDCFLDAVEHILQMGQSA